MFSFNSGDGRCPGCGGTGFEHVEMQFLSDVYLRCPDCNGRRYRDELLEVALPGADGRAASVADVLDMTVDDAVAFFAGEPKVRSRLEPLRLVGLGYVQMGQPVPTLSGGECQRLKLAGHLAESLEAAAKASRARSRRSSNAAPQRLLLILDEPTTGLHLDDVATLIRAFDALLEQGHSLLVIEHHLDVLRAADWLIDLGPEGGTGGRRAAGERHAG